MGSEVALIAGVQLFPGVRPDVLLKQKILSVDFGAMRTFQIRLPSTLTSLDILQESLLIAQLVVFGEIWLNEEVVFADFALGLGHCE